MRRALTLLALLVACILFAFPAHAAAAGWKAGVARAKITPATRMWMSGYAARDRPAEGTLHDLWAKALVLEDPSGRRALMLTLDLCGIDRAFSLRVREALRAQHGLPREAVALCVSHTHSGPVVGHNLRAMYFLNAEQNRLVDQYTAELETTLIALAGEAIGKLEPARLEWGIGSATFAANRRANAEGDAERLRAAGKLKGPFDHDLPVLRVTGTNGKLIAIAFGYACHATTLDIYHWSNDWPGFALLELEEKHPGCVALFWAGCGADQNPMPRRTVRLAKRHGREAAAGVEAVLAGAMKLIEGDLTLAYGEIDLPFGKLPSREQLEADAASKNRYAAVRAKHLLSTLDRDGKLAAAYPYPVQVWKLGRDLTFVLLGGEAVVDYALRLKAELGPGRTWVAGYANDVMAYIPSRRVLQEGGYEGGDAMVYYGLPAPWAPEVEDLIVKEVRRLAARAGERK